MYTNRLINDNNFKIKTILKLKLFLKKILPWDK